MTRSPTPRSAPAPRRRSRNGFPPNSPYNADLPYDIEQIAVFGEAQLRHHRAASRHRRRPLLRLLARRAQFNSGGLFSNRDNRTDETSSNGFSPRFILSYEPADNVRVNAQASKGFRLGGVNDPLNLPLCIGRGRRAIFGGFQDL